MKFSTIGFVLSVLRGSNAAPTSSSSNGNPYSGLISSLGALLQQDAASTGPLAPITSQIISDYAEPLKVKMIVPVWR